MRILILNWRDIKNPAGGGAEQLTHEIAKRWVSSGHTVSQFSSSFHTSKNREIIDGVTYIRKGKWWTVHVHAFFYYQHYKKDFDLIIDEVHWFPFFAALYAPSKTIALTCEVATNLLFRIMPYPLALFFALLEKIYFLLYKHVPTMVISQSTKDDIIATGHPENNILVVPMGVTVPDTIKNYPKDKNPVIISVSRLNLQKGTLDLIDAFAEVNKQMPETTLWLVGKGEEDFKKILEQRIASYNLESKIKLYDFVSEEKKFALLSQAHVLASASIQEGWGLTIHEAGLTGTPAVVYNIQGFRDIVTNNKNGLLVEKNPQSLANGILIVLNDKDLYTNLQISAKKTARQFSWDNAAKKAILFMTQQKLKLTNYDTKDHSETK